MRYVGYLRYLRYISLSYVRYLCSMRCVMLKMIYNYNLLYSRIFFYDCFKHLSRRKNVILISIQKDRIIIWSFGKLIKTYSLLLLGKQNYVLTSRTSICVRKFICMPSHIWFKKKKIIFIIIRNCRNQYEKKK